MQYSERWDGLPADVRTALTAAWDALRAHMDADPSGGLAGG